MKSGIDELKTFEVLQQHIAQEKILVEQIGILSQKKTDEKMGRLLLEKLKQTNENILQILHRIMLVKPLSSEQRDTFGFDKATKNIEKGENDLGKKYERVQANHRTMAQHNINPLLTARNYFKKTTEFERFTLKRLGKKSKKVTKKKIKKPSSYIKFANNLFSGISLNLMQKKMFRALKRNLVKANISILPTSYIAITLLTTIISLFAGFLLFIFFLFFNIVAELPIITQVTGSLFERFLKVFWIILAVPVLTFLSMYVYPSLEKKSNESRIDQELPFATIHMAAISGSMIEPSKIFSIIISTEEYPYLTREFTKLINEINVYGYDLVSALRNNATNSPSKKLAELFNGIATTISSGGNLPDFFDKRAQSLLFDYRLEREKYTRTAETFMDIYISVVIAAPMIFMLLLMMIKISGLGIALSNQMITLLMILGVTAINIVFLTFLHLKQPSK